MKNQLLFCSMVMIDCMEESTNFVKDERNLQAHMQDFKVGEAHPPKVSLGRQEHSFHPTSTDSWADNVPSLPADLYLRVWNGTPLHFAEVQWDHQGRPGGGDGYLVRSVAGARSSFYVVVRKTQSDVLISFSDCGSQEVREDNSRELKEKEKEK